MSTEKKTFYLYRAENLITFKKTIASGFMLVSRLDLKIALFLCKGLDFIL